MLASATQHKSRIRQQAEKAVHEIRARWPRLYFAMFHHRTTGGLPLSFRDRPWLTQIYKDNSELLTLMKCIQIGATELMICDMFSLASQGKRGMYLLPDDGWVGLWVADRVDGLLERVPEYKAAVAKTRRDTDSRRMKTIYGQVWKFAGTHAKTQREGDATMKRPKHAFEFASDALIIDEHDEHEERDLAMFHDRLAAAKKPIVRVLGNPTIDGRGIKVHWEKTDAKVYEVPCEHCGHHQQLSWKKHFVKKRGAGVWVPQDSEWDETREPRPICESCSEPFNRLNRGRWVATNPKGRGSGYAISRLFVNVRGTDIRELLEKWNAAAYNQTEMQNIHNQWLGETYVNEDDKLTETILAKAAGDYVTNGHKYTRCTAGIDQGAKYHMHISEIIEGKQVKRWLGACGSLGQCVTIMNEVGVICAGIDAQGGSYQETREFVEVFDGAWMVYYRGKDVVRNRYRTDYDAGVIEANRTEVCDAMVASFKKGETVIPQNWRSIDNGDFKKQMLTPQRVIDPRGIPAWTKGVDHHFHAAVYDWIAWQESGIYDSKKVNTNWR